MFCMVQWHAEGLLSLLTERGAPIIISPKWHRPTSQGWKQNAQDGGKEAQRVVLCKTAGWGLGRRGKVNFQITLCLKFLLSWGVGYETTDRHVPTCRLVSHRHQCQSDSSMFLDNPPAARGREPATFGCCRSCCAQASDTDTHTLEDPRLSPISIGWFGDDSQNSVQVPKCFLAVGWEPRGPSSPAVWRRGRHGRIEDHCVEHHCEHNPQAGDVPILDGLRSAKVTSIVVLGNDTPPSYQWS